MYRCLHLRAVSLAWVSLRRWGERRPRPGHGIIGAAVAAWPAVALVGSYGLLMMIIRGAQAPVGAPRPRDGVSVTDPLGEQAAVMFAAELAADRVPSVRAIRAALHVGQPRPTANGASPQPDEACR